MGFFANLSQYPGELKDIWTLQLKDIWILQGFIVPNEGYGLLTLLLGGVSRST